MGLAKKCEYKDKIDVVVLSPPVEIGANTDATKGLSGSAGLANDCRPGRFNEFTIQSNL
jgi:hypothetical protein